MSLSWRAGAPRYGERPAALQGASVSGPLSPCGPNRALVSLMDRANSPRATYCPLCPDLFGGGRCDQRFDIIGLCRSISDPLEENQPLDADCGSHSMVHSHPTDPRGVYAS